MDADCPAAYDRYHSIGQGQAMDFQQRLEKAIQRGQRSHDALARAKAEQAMGEEELRRLHTKYRLELSEHIEECVRQLPQHMPGFRYEGLSGASGWGGALSRDDLWVADGRRENYFSRLEMAVRPFSPSHVLELTAKGTIRNKEVFNRSQFQMLSHVDVASFRDLVDRWVLEYAELYAAKG
jgi:hypothetical protein